MSLFVRRIVLAVLCLVLLAVIITVSIRKDASSEASPASNSKKVLKITEAKEGQECPEGFVVKLAGNKGQKLDDAHEVKVNALLVKYQGNELSQEVLKMHLNLAKQDPRFLYMLIQGVPSLQSVADLKSESDISKQGCYTAKGREAWKLLRGALVTSVAEPRSEAPADGVNTGVNEGGVYQTAPGITGDRRAVQYETKNGFTFWIMYRCGNLVVRHIIPGVPTTAPPTTNPPGTNPPGTNPPGTNPPGTQPPRTTAPPHTAPPTTRPPCTDNNHDGKCDTHVVGRPLPGGAGGPQAPDSDPTPDTQDPDGTHQGSSQETGCHGGCTGGTPTTTRPAPPSTVQPTPTTVPATTAPTVPPPP